MWAKLVRKCCTSRVGQCSRRVKVNYKRVGACFNLQMIKLPASIAHSTQWTWTRCLQCVRKVFLKLCNGTCVKYVYEHNEAQVLFTLVMCYAGVRTVEPMCMHYKDQRVHVHICMIKCVYYVWCGAKCGRRQQPARWEHSDLTSTAGRSSFQQHLNSFFVTTVSHSRGGVPFIKWN